MNEEDSGETDQIDSAHESPVNGRPATNYRCQGGKLAKGKGNSNIKVYSHESDLKQRMQPAEPSYPGVSREFLIQDQSEEPEIISIANNQVNQMPNMSDISPLRNEINMLNPDLLDEQDVSSGENAIHHRNNDCNEPHIFNFDNQLLPSNSAQALVNMSASDLNLSVNTAGTATASRNNKYKRQTEASQQSVQRQLRRD